MKKKLFVYILFLVIPAQMFAQLSNNAVRFDGADDVVSVMNQYDFGTHDFTFELWFRADTIGYLLSFYYPDLTGDAMGLCISNNGNLWWWVNGSGPIIPSVNLCDNTCHHVAIVRQSGAGYIYIDSTQYGPFWLAGLQDSLAFVNPLVIGGWYEADHGSSTGTLKGIIKEVRLWWVARTQSQIQSNMNVVLNAASNPNLMGYWRCSEGSGTLVHDYAGFNNGYFGYDINSPSNLFPSWGIGCMGCTPPSANITTGGATTFCSGGSVVLSAVVAANRAYQWMKNGVDIPGATLSSYTATASGTYKVTVTNTITGCFKISAAGTKVTVNPKPYAHITPQGPTTFCAGGSVVLFGNTTEPLTYKWKKNNTLISGVTLSNYTATTAGTYRVETTNSNGCSKLSAGVTVAVPCKLSESESESESVRMDSYGENEFDVKIFPNPNSGEFTIKLSTKPASPIQIELTDELGKGVKKFETADESVLIKELSLAKGIYYLTIRNKDELRIKKINIKK